MTRSRLPSLFLVHTHSVGRGILLHRFPYALYYRIEGGHGILVVACLHHALDPSRRGSRLAE